MTELEHLQAGATPSYLREEMLSTVRHSAACFVRPDGSGQPLRQCGSGTFVRYKEHFGILTAAHVIRALQKFDRWFLVMLNGRVLMFSHQEVEYLCTPTPVKETDGPDIGFIRLSPFVASNLAAMFSFVNLESHQARLPDRLDPTEGFWIEVGFPEEMSSQRSAEEGQRGVYCVAAVGGIDSISERAGFDYYDGSVRYDGPDYLPKSFKGMSGAGLWLLRLAKKNGRYLVLDSLLSGVVFCELYSEGIVSEIRSHGQKSIYGPVVNDFILKLSVENG